MFVTKQLHLHIPSPSGAVQTEAVTTIRLRIRFPGRYKAPEVTRLGARVSGYRPSYKDVAPAGAGCFTVIMSIT
jgi:hypothetical protein